MESVESCQSINAVILAQVVADGTLHPACEGRSGNVPEQVLSDHAHPRSQWPQPHRHRPYLHRTCTPLVSATIFGLHCSIAFDE